MSGQTVAERTRTDDPRARLLAGTTIAERSIEAAGLSTAVLEAGAGPDVVLLHGPGEFAAGWAPVLTGLAATHHVVAPDLPGHGESAAPADLDVPHVLSWLADVIAATCISKPVLIGRVVGGAIAARLAIVDGDRVRQLVLVDTLGLTPFAPAPPFGEALHRFFSEPDEDTFTGAMRYCAHDLDSLRRRLGDRWPALVDYAVDRLRTPGVVEAAGALIAQFGAVAIPDVDLARITVPVTLIWGRHDLATPLAVAEAASRAFGWPLHVVDDAADDPALEQPEAFLDAVRSTINGEVQ
jgi:pimeloyl-ACP methyl ester carboxylesterase